MKINYKKIEVLSTLVQTIAVVAGIGFAVNEYVIKDRDAERSRMAVAKEIAEEDRSERIASIRKEMLIYIRKRIDNTSSRLQIDSHQLVDELMSIEDSVRQLRAHYAILSYCLKASVCNRDLLTVLICPTLVLDAYSLNPIENFVGWVKKDREIDMRSLHHELTLFKADLHGLLPICDVSLYEETSKIPPYTAVSAAVRIEAITSEK